MGAIIIPVIHHVSDELSLHNAEIIAQARCWGLFLISMRGEDHLLNGIASRIKKSHEGLKIGINRLSDNAVKSIEANRDLGIVEMTWADNCGIHSTRVDPMTQHIQKALGSLPSSHLFFAPAAFKYQPQEPDPSKAAKIAADFGWIATTSGSGTGQPPSVEKIRTMKAAIRDRPLANASGITPANAHLFKDYLSYIIVSTGINTTPTSDITDPKKLADLMAAVA